MGKSNIAFPHGSDKADLDQTLCRLLQEQKPEFYCDDKLQELSAASFVETYKPHEAYCNNNADLVAAVLGGTHPDSQQIMETAMAEALYFYKILDVVCLSIFSLFWGSLLSWHFCLACCGGVVGHFKLLDPPPF